MSRIGKKIIVIPSSVSVEIKDDFIKMKGQKGDLMQKLHPNVKVENMDGSLRVTVNNPDEKNDRSLWGLFGSIIKNMVQGVTVGFERKLEINGVGFKVVASGNVLTFNVGYSHQVKFTLPEGISAVVEKNIITLTGIDKHLIGQVAADIRKIKKPEPYKGKGIKYLEEVIRRKAGKAAGK